MREERLIEITSTINELDGAMQVMTYLSTLSDSEIYLFLSCIRGSKFKDLNTYEGIIRFSKNYIKNKEASLDMEFLDNFERRGPLEVKKAEEEINTSYLEHMSFETPGAKKRK